jgi:UDP-N-acetylmuramate--alanine ligase
VTGTKIAIAAGGTAGHVAPALAVAGALRAEGAEVVFVGGTRAEAQLVPAAGYDLRPISVEGLSRTNPLHAVRAVVRAAVAVSRARAILKELRPDAVLGGGGYVAGPVGLAALSLRIPLVLTEADSQLGLANRLLARAARRVCVAFPIPGRAGSRYRVTGRPIPVPDADRAGARARFQIADEETCVLVFGGSLGARSINLAAVEAFAGDESSGIGARPGTTVEQGLAAGVRDGTTVERGLAAGVRDGTLRVLHIAGRRDHAELARRELPAGYDLREYLDLDEFAQALAAADLVVARSGGSVFEIAAYGLPAILVPYPHASADHQSANARWMTDADAAVVIPDFELSGARLAREVAVLLADRSRLAAMADASRSLARPDAAREVADELLRAASSPRGGARMSTSERAWSGRRLHIVGVGGAGMSGYARAAHALGAQVSGSDRVASPYTERLAADGVLRARIGDHDAANVPDGEDVEVVYSSAVPPENPERAVARARGLPERPRAELLGELTALRRTIAVAGTHGKTTTSAMLVSALRAAGLQPDWLVGGTVGEGQDNASWTGAGEWLVVEADESDRSMLALNVDIAVLTNVELDHHATFGSLAQLREAFRAFLARARRAIVVWDRPGLLELAPDGAVEVLPYDVPAPALGPDGARFQWRGHEVRLAVPGAHNALNAIAALEAARLAGADEERAVAGLAGFHGAGRRFQPLGETVRGARVYDDYAHHPTEVAATLAGASTLAHERLIAVFQPHLYSRTAMFAREFGAALAQADVVVVLDVYPARERAEDHPGVTGLLAAEAAADAAEGRPVYWLPTFAGAEPVLRELLEAGDVCVAMGAGDVDALARRLVVSDNGGRGESGGEREGGGRG